MNARPPERSQSDGNYGAQQMLQKTHRPHSEKDRNGGLSSWRTGADLLFVSYS